MNKADTAIALTSSALSASAYHSEHGQSDKVISAAMGLTGNPLRFHEDLTAKQALVEWLAEDDERWKQFTDALAWRVGLDTNEIEEVLRFYMLATPVQIAKAAIDTIEVIKRLEQS